MDVPPVCVLRHTAGDDSGLVCELHRKLFSTLPVSHTILIPSFEGSDVTKHKKHDSTHGILQFQYWLSTFYVCIATLNAKDKKINTITYLETPYTRTITSVFLY